MLHTGPLDKVTKKSQTEAEDYLEGSKNETRVLLALKKVLGLLSLAKWKFREATSIVLMKVIPGTKCNSKQKNTWYKIKKMP